MTNEMKLLLAFMLVFLQGCERGDGYHYELADGRGVCVEYIESHHGYVSVRSLVDNNLYTVLRSGIAQTVKCSALDDEK